MSESIFSNLFIGAIMEGLAIALKQMLECEKNLGASARRSVLAAEVPSQRCGVRSRWIFSCLIYSFP